MPDDTHIDLRERVAALEQMLVEPIRELAGLQHAILAKAHALCGAEHGALVTYDGEYFRLAANHGIPQFWIKQFRQPYRAAPALKAAEYGRPARH